MLDVVSVFLRASFPVRVRHLYDRPDVLQASVEGVGERLVFFEALGRAEEQFLALVPLQYFDGLWLELDAVEASGLRAYVFQPSVDDVLRGQLADIHDVDSYEQEGELEGVDVFPLERFTRIVPEFLQPFEGEGSLGRCLILDFLLAEGVGASHLVIDGLVNYGADVAQVDGYGVRCEVFLTRKVVLEAVEP